MAAKVKNRDIALWGGIGCIIAGSWLLHDAFENRGRKRPWAISWLPGA